MGFEAKCVCSKHVARGTWKRFASMHYKYFRFDIDPKRGKISAQPHTSLYIHIWGFIIQCITSKMYMHN